MVFDPFLKLIWFIVYSKHITVDILYVHHTTCNGYHLNVDCQNLFLPATYKYVFSQLHTCHAARKTFLSGFLPVRLTHPATQLALCTSGRDGNGVPLVLGDNHRLALNSSHIFRVCTCQPAAKQSTMQKKMRKAGYELRTMTLDT